MNIITKLRKWAKSLVPKAPSGTLTIWFNDGDIYRWTFMEDEFWSQKFIDWYNNSDNPCDRITMRSGAGLTVLNFSHGDIRRYKIELNDSPTQ